MSTTPRTDAEAALTRIDCDDSCCEVRVYRDDFEACDDIVTAGFARTLEAELARYSGWAKWKEGLWKITHTNGVHDAEYIGPTDALAAMTELAKRLANTLSDASDHLEYCGYGDSWEREGAIQSKLDQRIDSALTAAREAGIL